MDQNYQIEARYVILTQSILGDKSLTSSDKLLLARISGFERFFEANETTAEFLGISERTIREAKQRLLRLGYIVEIANTGHGKIYAPDLIRLAKTADETGRNCRPDRQILPPENKIENKNRINKGEDEKKPETYGREDINELVTLWQSETGIDIKNDKNERRQLYNLIRKTGAERAKALVKAVGDTKRSQDRYAPQIATPRDLMGKYGKLQRLELWLDRKNASRPFGETINPAPNNALPSRELPRYDGAFEIQDDAEREAVSKAFKEARKKLPFTKKGGQDD